MLLGKFFFVCGAIGHTKNFCSGKYESCSAKSKKKWGSQLQQENNSVGGHKVTSKWLIGGRSKNFGGWKEEGTLINDNQSSDSITYDGYGKSRHKIYGRIKVEVDAQTRTITFYKFMECQWLDEAGLLR